jgi:2'-5' RNA ligase
MRLFVGLRPPLAIREQLMSTMEGVPDARWQHDEQLHITLRFIGDVEPPQAEDVALALTGVAIAPLTLRIKGVGAFRTRGQVRALWARITPREPLTALHKKIDQALIRIGLAPEGRAYLPHITLARMKGRATPAEQWLADHGALSSEAFVIDHMLLFESHLSPAGADYEAIARYAGSRN